MHHRGSTVAVGVDVGAQEPAFWCGPVLLWLGSGSRVIVVYVTSNQGNTLDVDVGEIHNEEPEAALIGVSLKQPALITAAATRGRESVCVCRRVVKCADTMSVWGNAVASYIRSFMPRGVEM